MGKSKAAPDRVIAAERRVKALELRKLGFTYRKIGDQLGVTEAAAHKMVTKSLRELNEKSAESASEVLRLELERLDEWTLRVAQEIKSGRTLAAIDRGIRIQARRARLLGLDAPTKVKFSELTDPWFEAMKAAVQAGDDSATAAMRRVADGESLMTVAIQWLTDLQPRVVVSAADAEIMTHEELVKATQGTLTHEELAEIRERAGEGQIEAESQ